MTESQILDIEAIMERIPHRFPFLLVDRVISVTPGAAIVAIKNVTANEAHFVGHFPGYPIMPGVLVVEALAQAGGLLAGETVTPEERAATIMYLVGIENARFKAMVRPGDRLILKAELTKRRRQLWEMHCVAEVDDKVVAEADVLMVGGKRS